MSKQKIYNFKFNLLNDLVFDFTSKEKTKQSFNDFSETVKSILHLSNKEIFLKIHNGAKSLSFNQLDSIDKQSLIDEFL